MSFLLSDVLPVLNVQSKKTSMLKRKENQSPNQKQNSHLLF